MVASREVERSEAIAIEGIQHAPENEAGVILLETGVYEMREVIHA